MSKFQILLHEPSFNDADICAVVEALKSSWVSTGGPDIDAFEKEMAAFVGSRYAVAVANGTVALQLMIEVLRRQLEVTGPFEILVPTLSFAATGNAVVHAGGIPIFMDVAPKSLNVSGAAVSDFVQRFYTFAQDNWISKFSGRRLLAVMPAHLMGWMPNLKSLTETTQDLQLPMLEDSAEALGVCAVSERKHAGTYGLAGGFSFNGNKILTTGGGGMVVTNDESFARRIKHLSTTARIDGVNYVHDEIGYNFRLVNLLAALGRAQLARLPALIEKKRILSETYRAMLADCGLLVHQESGCHSNHWLTNVIFSDFAERQRVLRRLNESGIQARPLWELMHRQPSFAKFSQPNSEFPNAQWAWERFLSLPSSAHLKTEAIETIVNLIRTERGENR